MSAAELESPAANGATRSRSHWGRVWRKLARDRVAIFCAAVLILVALASIFANVLPLPDPYDSSILNRLKSWGTPGHPLGTDELGRDMLARIVHGARLSLLCGVLPIGIAFVIGTALGMSAGYAGGVANTVIMRSIDVLFAFPSVLLAIAISGVLGAKMMNVIISLTIVFIPQITRIAESVTMAVRNLEYIDAARASGASAFTIVRVQVLPNVLGPVFVYATGLVPVSMIVAAGLSFLGIGTQPPAPEWGLMLNSLRTVMYTHPLLAITPGVMIFVVSICFNLLSDSLRGAMDISR